LAGDHHRARDLKPEIPATDELGRSIRDEIEFECIVV
jgi:hypothetical protein